jgi:hypothetical protein
MDPSLQTILDRTVFGVNTPWTAIDACFVKVRNGDQLPDTLPEELRLLSQALGAAFALNQWNHFQQLPAETVACCNATALRLTVLGVILSRNDAPRATTYTIPKELMGSRYVGLQFHHVNPALLVAGSLVGDTRVKIVDEIVSLLEGVPLLAQSPLWSLPQIRKSLKMRCNFQSPGLMSLTMVLPFGPWIQDILNRDGILKGDSFATLDQGGSMVELEIPSPTRQVLVAIRQDLRLNYHQFRRILDDSLSRAFTVPIKCWDTTVWSAGTGQQRSTTHIDPDAAESSIRFVVDIATLLLARRCHSHLELLLGRDQQFAIGIRFRVPPCPRMALTTMSRRLGHTSIRRREPGQSFGSSIVLIGLLPKNWAKDLGRDEAARMELYSTFETIAVGQLHAKEVSFFGRWERSSEPMGVCIEFNTVHDADTFGHRIDISQLPDEFNAFCHRWFGSDPSPDIWACTTLVEVLDTLRESELKRLIPRRSEQPGLVPPAALPDQGLVADGTGDAAGAPDNPNGAGH